MTKALTIEPVDVVHLRGNRLFADSGHGDAVVPPWPSLFAGALRSRIALDADLPFSALQTSEPPPGEAGAALGTLESPGSFRVGLTGIYAEGEIYLPLPSDLVLLPNTQQEHDPTPRFSPCPLQPQPPAALGSVDGSFALPELAVLDTPTRAKPLAGYWISLSGFFRHLTAQTIHESAFRHESALWQTDTRLGIGLDKERRTTSEGLLYTAECVSLRPGASFYVEVHGADTVLPRGGLLRFGGDGRGAKISPYPSSVSNDVERWAQNRWDTIAQSNRFRLVLVAPGLSEHGWLPFGVEPENEGYVLHCAGFRARLRCAACPRATVVSGWDLARARPKTALRAIPTGSVYWFEVLEGEATSALERIEREGLWACADSLPPELRQRRAEGFNEVRIGVWDPTEA